MPVAQLQVAFEPAKPRLLIKLEAGVRFDGKIPFWVFPADPDVVAVTVGSYLGDGKRLFDVKGEILKFEKASEAELKYPGVFSVATTSLPGATFRASDLSPVSPRWVFDRESGVVIAEDPATNAPVKIIGGVAVDYSAEYSRYLYTPEQENLGFTGTSTQYGSIIAIKGEAVETLGIDVGISDDKGYEEVYRIVSTVIASNGDISPDRWEKPPNWPEDGSFPISKEGPDPDSSFDDERIHEVGYVTKGGIQKSERFYHKNEKPYAGNPAYHPEYKLSKGSVSEPYQKAFNELDWSEILAEAGKRWPGVTG